MKEAYITIRDRHFTDDDGGDDYGELKTDCLIGTEDDSIVVRYHETVEKADDCDTSLRVQNNRITMMRNGFFRTGMIFENGKRHISCYETPFGEAMIGIYTNAMFIDFDENGGILDFAYTIDNNGDLLSENELKITVELKEENNVDFS